MTASSSDSSKLAVPSEYVTAVNDAAEKHGVPAAILAGLIMQESKWNPDARSPVGGVGLGQIMPATARHLGFTNRNDPVQIINGSAQYLSEQL